MKAYQSKQHAAQTSSHLERRYKEKWAMLCTLTQCSCSSARTSSSGTCTACSVCTQAEQLQKHTLRSLSTNGVPRKWQVSEPWFWDESCSKAEGACSCTTPGFSQPLSTLPNLAARTLAAASGSQKASQQQRPLSNGYRLVTTVPTSSGHFWGQLPL